MTDNDRNFKEHDEAEVIKYIEELLPLLEHSDFIYRSKINYFYSQL